MHTKQYERKLFNIKKKYSAAKCYNKREFWSKYVYKIGAESVIWLYKNVGNRNIIQKHFKYCWTFYRRECVLCDMVTILRAHMYIFN